MPRSKVKSPGEQLIAFFATAGEADCRALLLTAQTITAARFPPHATGEGGKKATRRPGRVAGTAAAVRIGSAPGAEEAKAAAPFVGRIQEEAAAKSPRRRRPPIAPTIPSGPVAAASAPEVTLPDQGTPGED
jgi:hypothetical protein